jgi:hypothetical protein
MWKYSIKTVKAEEEKLDIKLNEFGKSGWEVFFILNKGTVSEFSSTGAMLSKFIVYMKQKA